VQNCGFRARTAFRRSTRSKPLLGSSVIVVPRVKRTSSPAIAGIPMTTYHVNGWRPIWVASRRCFPSSWQGATTLFYDWLARLTSMFTTARLAPVTLESRSGIGHSHYLGCGRQSEMKGRAPSVVRRGPQTATMGLDNGTADG
jgi:hypothetical protein